jgi:hypothetical protein
MPDLIQTKAVSKVKPSATSGRSQKELSCSTSPVAAELTDT